MLLQVIAFVQLYVAGRMHFIFAELLFALGLGFFPNRLLMVRAFQQQ